MIRRCGILFGLFVLVGLTPTYNLLAGKQKDKGNTGIFAKFKDGEGFCNPIGNLLSTITLPFQEAYLRGKIDPIHEGLTRLRFEAENSDDPHVADFTARVEHLYRKLQEVLSGIQSGLYDPISAVPLATLLASALQRELREGGFLPDPERGLN